MCNVTQEFTSAVPVASETKIILGDVRENRNCLDSVGYAASCACVATCAASPEVL